MAVLGIGRTTLWRTRAAYLEGGAEHALHDLPRPGKPRRYDTDVEAGISALACSKPPVGAKRWTLELLEQAAQAQVGMSSISRETIRRLLKKLHQTVAQADVVYRHPDAGVSATHGRSARPLRPPVAAGRTRRLSGREEQTVAQGFSCAFADPLRNTHAPGL
jgi:transposase